MKAHKVAIASSCHPITTKKTTNIATIAIDS
jgi:hypothetical protein